MNDEATPAEAAKLARRRPLNWDDMGSSARDLWEARHLRSIRRAAREDAQ